MSAIQDMGAYKLIGTILLERSHELVGGKVRVIFQGKTFLLVLENRNNVFRN
ncbi:MAG: hypothetical protein ABIR15_14635 [Chitinophagaceae bacterium]